MMLLAVSFWNTLPEALCRKDPGFPRVIVLWRAISDHFGPILVDIAMTILTYISDVCRDDLR